MEKMIVGSQMKKTLLGLILGALLSTSMVYADNVPDQYIQDIERISTRYNADMKFFLRSLDPKITQFNSAQQKQFCGILKTYVDDMYKTTDQHRKYLPVASQAITKQTIIDKVKTSPEMQILKRYNIQCDLN